MKEDVMPPVPVMLKHPILARLDELSRDRRLVAAMRDLLKCEATPEELADVAVRKEVCSRELADSMLLYWANVDGSSGWLGDIFAECRRGFLEAAESILERDVPLSAWWLLGFSPDFRLLVVPESDRIDLFMATPQLSDPVQTSKRAPNPLDPGFSAALEEVRRQVDALLA